MKNNHEMGFWRSFAKSFKNEFARQQEPEKPLKTNEARAEELMHEFDIASVVHMEKIGDCFVDMRLYVNRIARMIKKPCVNDLGKVGYERFYLTDFTTATAEKCGMAFSFASCIEFTKSELSGKAANETNGKVQIKPLVGDKKSINANDQIGPAYSKATGRVVFAGENVIHPKGPGRVPYKTFSVAIRTAEGDVYFSGVDLEKKFRSEVFSIGDLVSIEKSASEFTTEYAGQKSVRTKNDYKVVVLKKA